MDLLKPEPPLDLYQRDWAIRTTEKQAPPARTVRGPSGQKSELENSILASGAVVAGGSVTHSVLSQNVRVDDSADVTNCILFDHVQVGSRARLRNCIVDKHVRIPAGESIGYDLERDRKRFKVADNGIVVVPGYYKFTPEKNSDTEDETNMELLTV